MAEAGIEAEKPRKEEGESSRVESYVLSLLKPL